MDILRHGYLGILCHGRHGRNSPWWARMDISVFESKPEKGLILRDANDKSTNHPTDDSNKHQQPLPLQTSGCELKAETGRHDLAAPVHPSVGKSLHCPDARRSAAQISAGMDVRISLLQGEGDWIDWDGHSSSSFVLL